MTDAPLRIEQHSITTRDKTLLHATLYRPHDPNDHAVVIGAAMGAKQSLYRHYASYLAEQGFVVLTFDYRGIGASHNGGSLWGYDADLLQWGSQDLQAVLAWMLRQYPAHELHLVAHSISGQLLGLTTANDAVTSMLGVPSQNIYWRLWNPLFQPIMLLFWYVILPLATMAFGYFPSKLFGLGAPVPKGVARDWSRAGRSRFSLLDVYGGSVKNHFADFYGRIRLYSFSDDAFLAPRRAVANLIALYPNANASEHIHLRPKDINQKSIGHSGFFHPRMRETLWQSSAEWLRHADVEVTPEPVAELSR